MPHVRDELLVLLRCPVTRSSLVQDGDDLVSTVPGPGGQPLRYRIEDEIVLLLRPEQVAAAVSAGSDQHDPRSADQSFTAGQPEATS
ncbi:hypothetical protein [Arthrobacter sp. H14-L1]|uniref:hypothetical protein n=1 Tax=Arthrobacter sp. H14-L1 TaxID=2996697 RepID=UPI00226D98E1|nr:hypothetical protein [Arthrobacter sp. H14-L1]MCY0904942.1 hypothetical protein [Arthrobacter sp. H14-L1]